jgi:hypothetical protein
MSIKNSWRKPTPEFRRFLAGFSAPGRESSRLNERVQNIAYVIFTGGKRFFPSVSRGFPLNGPRRRLRIEFVAAGEFRHDAINTRAKTAFSERK